MLIDGERMSVRSTLHVTTSGQRRNWSSGTWTVKPCLLVCIVLVFASLLLGYVLTSGWMATLKGRQPITLAFAPAHTDVRTKSQRNATRGIISFNPLANAAISTVNSNGDRMRKGVDKENQSAFLDVTFNNVYKHSHQATSSKGEISTFLKVAGYEDVEERHNSSFFSIFLPQDDWRGRMAGNSTKPQKTKAIFSYNLPTWFPWREPIFGGCDVDACVVTKDQARRESADAVMFYVCRLPEQPPTYQRPWSQVWVAYCGESPLHYNSEYKLGPWRGVFNWTMLYRTDADIFDPYAFLTRRVNITNKDYTAIASSKTKMAAWFVSNCHSSSKREKYVAELQKYIDVDIFGMCGTKRCTHSTQSLCMSLLNTKYRFYLSFENSLCLDYVTEKFFKVFADVHVIPVVRGGANYKKYFPPGTFINTADFQTPRHLADYLKRLASDPESYAAILREKDHYTLEDSKRSLCDLCRKLHFDNTPKTYPDFPKWFEEEDACWEPKDMKAL